MCTLIVATRAWRDAPLVVAANRDELLARPAQPPRIRELLGCRLFAPSDQQAGGTWIGLNTHGVFGALTNRFRAPADATRRSRGEIIPLALRASTAREAAQLLGGLDGQAYNPFHVVVADREEAWLAWCGPAGAATPVRLAAGVHIVTERSLGAAPTLREPLIRAALDARPGTEGFDDAALIALLSTHAPDGVCVHRADMGYGTRSSSLVRLGASPGELTWRHAEGAPCVTAFEDLSGIARSL